MKEFVVVALFSLCLCLSLQLQSNLIPGLNLNALGLFPSGPQGMGPSMPSVAPPGAYGGSPFGVSPSLFTPPPLGQDVEAAVKNIPHLYWLCFILFSTTSLNLALGTSRGLELCSLFSPSSVLTGSRVRLGPLCRRRCRRAASSTL